MDYDMPYELPSVQEVFYGRNEPTYLYDSGALRQPRMEQMGMGMRGGYPGYPREMEPNRYRTQALVAPTQAIVPLSSPNTKTVSTIHHPQGLTLSVPMCCEKCVEKVRMSLMSVPGVTGVVCDQYEHKVKISGHVNPDEALRRVRRVKRKSLYWNMATQPLKYSSHTVPEIHTVVKPSRFPSYSTSANRGPQSSSSAYSRFVSPPRQYTSSYSRGYSSPYIDSAYRSGYGERGYNHYNSAYNRSGYGEPRYGNSNSAYDRFSHGDPRYGHSSSAYDRSGYGDHRHDQGTPYVRALDF